MNNISAQNSWKLILADLANLLTMDQLKILESITNQIHRVITKSWEKHYHRLRVVKLIYKHF